MKSAELRELGLDEATVEKVQELHTRDMVALRRKAGDKPLPRRTELIQAINAAVAAVPSDAVLLNIFLKVTGEINYFYKWAGRPAEEPKPNKEEAPNDG